MEVTNEFTVPLGIDEALDLFDVAGRATARRLAPVLAPLPGLVGLIPWRRHHRS